MSRQYVHLSTDPNTAREVGARKDTQPIILLVRSGEAHRNGVLFYEGNESVCLTDYVPPAFISSAPQ
jgi:putative RNA 2'-phosphotransferase